MLTMNKKMNIEMQNISLDGKKLPTELSKLIASGFHVRDNHTFLVSLSKIDTNVSADDFPDKTGYECFINSVYIDDYVESDYLAFAFLFLKELFNEWDKFGSNEVLRAIISFDEFGALIKFHIARKGESWISEELESYEESILVTDSLTGLTTP